LKIEQIKILNNTLNTLYIDAKLPSVTILLLFKVGSINDETNYEGIAHFLEHCLFKRTSKYKDSLELSNAIELIGGSANAFTSYEYTGYYIKVPTIKYIEAIGIISELVINPRFNKIDVRKEKGVIKEEIKMYDDMPKQKVKKLFQEKIFSNSKLGNDIAGSIDSVENIEIDDLYKHLDKYYNLRNLHITIVGNIDEKLVTELLESTFINYNYGDIFSTDKITRNILNRQVYKLSQQTEQTHIVMGGYSYPRIEADRYALAVGNSLLSYGFGSLLFQKIREDLGLAYYVYSNVSMFESIGKYSISMGVDSKKIMSAINSVEIELNNVANGKFSKTQLERAKNYLIGSYITEFEASDNLAIWYGTEMVNGYDISKIDNIIKTISNISVDDIVRIWQPIINKDNIIFTLIGAEEYLNKIDNI
jgi:predicted Zn-dependent peptidase